MKHRSANRITRLGHASDVANALGARWSTPAFAGVVKLDELRLGARVRGRLQAVDRSTHIPCSRRCWTVTTSATLHRLERATEAYHAAADAPWLALMSPAIHERAYMNQLALAYGFEGPVESAFAYTAGLDAVISVRTRLRAGLIAQDLLALGATPSELVQLPQCSSIIPFVELSDALGWMFVLERAALLHDGVRRSVAHRLPRAAHAVAYLSTAGSVAGARWQSFGSALDRFTETAAIADQIASAASRAFGLWRDWTSTNARGPTWSPVASNA